MTEVCSQKRFHLIICICLPVEINTSVCYNAMFDKFIQINEMDSCILELKFLKGSQHFFGFYKYGYDQVMVDDVKMMVIDCELIVAIKWRNLR